MDYNLFIFFYQNQENVFLQAMQILQYDSKNNMEELINVRKRKLISIVQLDVFTALRSRVGSHVGFSQILSGRDSVIRTNLNLFVFLCIMVKIQKTYRKASLSFNSIVKTLGTQLDKSPVVSKTCLGIMTMILARHFSSTWICIYSNLTERYSTDND